VRGTIAEAEQRRANERSGFSRDNIVSITTPEEATPDKKAQKHATPRQAQGLKSPYRLMRI
jgi:hypothetical protein